MATKILRTADLNYSYGRHEGCKGTFVPSQIIYYICQKKKKEKIFEFKSC
jgi:hypothetical protein